MRTRWLAVVVAAGCGAKPAEPLEPPAQVTVAPPPASASEPSSAAKASSPDPTSVPVATSEPALAFPRPDVDLGPSPPDVAAYGRWPLTVAEHPELEPHFAIAATLAQPGITWQELCARGAQHRHMARDAELGEYLAAWCSVAKDDPPDALYRLGSLRRSRKLAAAIELDAAAILVSTVGGDAAEGELRRAGLLETRIVDLAAATYFEVGKLGDAYELNALAEGMDHEPSAATTCARRLRALADGSATQRAEAFEVLVNTATLHGMSGAGDCGELATALVCWSGRGCAAAAASVASAATQPHRDGGVELRAAVLAWPVARATYDTWWSVANHASESWPYVSAYRLAVPALELALRTSQCNVGRLNRLQELSHQMQAIDNEHFLEWHAPAGAHTDSFKIPLEGDLAAFAPRLAKLETTIADLRREQRDACLRAVAALPPVTP